MDELLEDMFSAGVNAYWSGKVPKHWNKRAEREKSPFLTGWYMASMLETMPGWIVDADGDPVQEDGEW